jgi:hypothetical protein
MILSEVPFSSDRPSPVPSCFFLDNTHSKSIFGTFLLMLTLITLHIIASFLAPRIFGFADIYFPLRSTEVNTSVDVDVTISSLHSLHRFCDVNGSLVRHRPSTSSITADLSFHSRTLFLKNGTVVNSLNFAERNTKVTFLTGATSSTPFRVFHKEVFDYDSTQSKITLSADFESIEGFSFRWSFVNPLAFRVAQVSLFVLSFQIGYMVVLYVRSMSRNENLFIQLFCLVVGIAGVFVANPIALLLPSVNSLHMSDHAMMAVYIALFRLFNLVELETIRRQKPRPNFLWLMAIAVFFAFYGIVDHAAAYDRAKLLATSEFEVDVVFPAESLRRSFHLAYVGVAAFWMLLAFCRSRKTAGKRLAVFSVFTFVGIGEAILSQFQWAFLEDFAFTVVPQVFHASVNMTEGAFLLFFMRNDRPTEYQQIGSGEENGGILIDDFEAEDEDEEEEKGKGEEEEEGKGEEEEKGKEEEEGKGEEEEKEQEEKDEEAYFEEEEEKNEEEAETESESESEVDRN